MAVKLIEAVGYDPRSSPPSNQAKNDAEYCETRL